jgi:hypothetical protein
MTNAATSTFSTRISLALAACAVLTAGACDKGGDKKHGAAGAAGKGLSAASAVAPAGGLKRALSIMPADSEFVMALDWKQASASPLWAKYRDRAMQQVTKDLAEFKQVCGWDPMDKVTGLLAAGRNSGNDATILVRGLDKAAVFDCLKKFEAKRQSEGKPIQLAIDGDYFELIEPGDDTPGRFLFLDGDTVLAQIVNEKMVDKAALSKLAAAKDGDGLMSSQIFASLIDATDTTATMWFVVNGKASFMSQIPMSLVAVFGSVKAVDGVDGVVTVRLPDAAEDDQGVGHGVDADGPGRRHALRRVRQEGEDLDQGARPARDLPVHAAQLEKMAEQAQSLAF